MGTFGAGVFESDAALDARDSVLRHVEGELRSIAEATDYCFEDTESAMGLAAVLGCIVQGCGGAHLLSKSAVARWKERTIQITGQGAPA